MKKMAIRLTQLKHLIRCVLLIELMINATIVSAFTSTLTSPPTYELGIEAMWFPQQMPAVHSNGGHVINDNNRGYTSNQHGYITLNWDTALHNDQWVVEVDAYAAWNHYNENRQRTDIRNLTLNYYGNNIDVKAGIAIEFWGVTESRHLVDILNQSSLADNIDEEVKLGQPMLKWQAHLNSGSIQLYWLPLFRERLFPEIGTRLTPILPIQDNNSQYSSSSKKKHQDFALRYSNTIGAWDLGLSFFKGTSREPLLEANVNLKTGLHLSPYYEQIEQSSIDLQYTSDGLLLKLESIKRHGDRQRSYHAMVTGFEFTHIGAFNSAVDLGYIAEYLYDQRGDTATTPFQDDLFLGLRLAANNIAQTSLLLGIYQDIQNSDQTLRVELNTRLHDGLVLTVESQHFRNITPNSLLDSFRHDDYIRTTLTYYF